MKKLAALILSLMMVMTSLTAFADMDESLFTDTLRINLNTGTVTLNDETLDTAMPYINENGVTMAELSTLVTALGAEIEEAEGTFTVTYAGVTISYTDGSDIALIADQSLTMPAPIIRNADGAIMAPLRFVAEALGADVTYDGELGEIVVVASGGLDEDISYLLLFKYSGKSKVGNSKELWRFTKTDNFDMTDSYYGGYEFAMDDIYIYMDVEKNDGNAVIKQLYSEMQGSDSYYYSRRVMYDKGINEQGEIKSAYVKYRTVDTIFEYYAYVTDKFVYRINIERIFETFAGAKDNADVNTFISSLEFNYTGGDEENTVDLATVDMEELAEDSEPKTEYTDANYNWSVKLNSGWTAEEYYGFYNRVAITKPTTIEGEDEDEYDIYSDMYDSNSYDPAIYVYTYSNHENQTVGQWAEQKKSVLKKMHNPDIFEVSNTTDLTINGLPAKAFQATATHGDETSIMKYYYINHNGYRYELVLSYDKREENDPSFISSANEVIQSFTPGEINAEEVGRALEADNEILSLDILSTFDGEKFSFAYPCTWSVSESESSLYVGTDTYYNAMSYDVINLLMPELSIIAASGDGASLTAAITSLSYYDEDLNANTYTAEEYMKKNLSGMLNFSTSLIKVTLDSEIEEVQLMGLKGYKAELTAEADSEKIYYTTYYLPYSETEVLTITKTCSSDVINTAFDTAIDKIIESMKLVK